jgi:putative nucleotidyltransferase with HDIG domain
MNALMAYQENSNLMIGNGKQLIGYAGIIGQGLGNVYQNICCISLVDHYAQTHRFEVESLVYDEIVERYECLTLDNTENLFIWVEVATNGRLINWRLFKTTLVLEQIYPIYQACYDFRSLYQLLEFTESLKVVPLRMFVREVLADRALMSGFVSLPASKSHHHSFPGGLLMHSLECAYITQQTVDTLSDVSTNEKEVAMVAALFHDIGKVKTISENSHTSLGRLIDHELLTLQLLSDPLQELQKYWEQGADALQYLLVWKESMGFCRFVAGNAIKMADRMSTSYSLNRMAFKDKPEYFHFAQINIGSKTHHLNRLN